jgi:hypothetical protein
VCLAIWSDEVVPVRFDLQRAGLRTLAARRADKIGLLCVVQPSAPPPDAAMRSASIRMIDELHTRLGGVACVFGGEGLIAASTRSVLSAMALVLNRASVPIKLTGNVSAGAAWLATRCEGTSTAELMAAHDMLALRLQNSEALPVPAAQPGRPAPRR